MDINFNGIPVFKGLQKPLEFMGIRGRFLTYAAAAIGISFLGFLLSHLHLREAAQRTAQQETPPRQLLLL